MKNIIKITIAFVFVLTLGFQGCYEEYAKDFEYSAVSFGAQRPLRTVVARGDKDELEFKIGVTLSGMRNPKGYSVSYQYAPELMNDILEARKLTEMPKEWYTIENGGDFTFHIPAGKTIGDCPVKINKKLFTDDPATLGVKYAIPLKLVKTDADTILFTKNWTIIVVKYVDERSGAYYCRGWEAEWDPLMQVVIQSTLEEYNHIDDNRNKLRLISTLSLSKFEVQGMGSTGNANGTSAAADRMYIEFKDGKMELTRKASSTNAIEDLGSSYNHLTRTFTLSYIYTKGGKQYKVFETLKLRQDVEKELRFEEWMEGPTVGDE